MTDQIQVKAVRVTRPECYSYPDIAEPHNPHKREGYYFQGENLEDIQRKVFTSTSFFCDEALDFQYWDHSENHGKMFGRFRMNLAGRIVSLSFSELVEA